MVVFTVRAFISAPTMLYLRSIILFPSVVMSSIAQPRALRLPPNMYVGFSRKWFSTLLPTPEAFELGTVKNSLKVTQLSKYSNCFFVFFLSDFFLADVHVSRSRPMYTQSEQPAIIRRAVGRSGWADVVGRSGRRRTTRRPPRQRCSLKYIRAGYHAREPALGSTGGRPLLASSGRAAPAVLARACDGSGRPAGKARRRQAAGG
jgi:hypothetical protein